MANFDDFDKAEDKINEFIKLRDKLIDASPFLNDVRFNLSWHKKVCTEIPEQTDNILTLLDDAIKSTLALDLTTFSVGNVTGATGSFHSVSGDTRSIIQSYGKDHYHLITEYDAINKTEDFVDKII